MTPLIRLDKALAASGERTRSDAHRLIRGGCVTVNGAPVRDPARKIDNARDAVCVSGASISTAAHQYWLLCKPAGVLTAARDRHAPTVMSLVPPSLLARDVLPVGRLDKDTTGLLLLTDDGELAHRLLSPRRHVEKTYRATVSGRLTDADVTAFSQGITRGGFTALPAVLRILTAGDETSAAEAVVCEGQFHQIKRMFGALGHEVLALRRVQFGSLHLPDDLPDGAARPLTDGELAALRLDAALAPEATTLTDGDGASLGAMEHQPR